MSAAVLLAALAGAAAAGALVEAMTAARTRGLRRARRPGRLLALLARLGRRAGLPLPIAADLRARMDRAGLSERLAPADVAAMKAGAALAAVLGALPLLPAVPGRGGVLLLAAAPAAGFLAPDVWLARRARRRVAAMALEVADVVDLLRVAVAAGVPPARALGEVGRRRGGLLGAELAAAAGRLALGEPRAHTYARLRARCPVPAVAALCSTLERADRHGAPPAPALAALAAQARADRARALQERAARAAPRIQLVVALVLVPAVLLLVAGALVDGLR